MNMRKIWFFGVRAVLPVLLVLVIGFMVVSRSARQTAESTTEAAEAVQGAAEAVQGLSDADVNFDSLGAEVRAFGGAIGGAIRTAVDSAKGR